jgi:hypothetical protein
MTALVRQRESNRTADAAAAVGDDRHLILQTKVQESPPGLGALTVRWEVPGRYWPDGANPLEDRILIGGGAANMSEYQDEPVRQIVGIVGNVRSEGLANEPGPLMYVPHAQLPNALSTLVASSLPKNWVVRTRGDAPGVLRAVQDELRLVTRSPTTDVRTIEDVVSLSVSRHRLHMLLISVFAGSALLLAAVGVFGVLAYAVQQQTKDIGIRMALGAREGQIKSMVLRRGASLIAIGGAIGIVVAFFLSRLLAAVLFGVEPHDPAVFVAVPAILGLVGAVAIFLPAHWASRLNPLDALRND